MSRSLPTSRLSHPKGIWQARLAWVMMLWTLLAEAHVGNPHVIFEGIVGTFPLRVVIRQPDVVPGLAEISLRVLSGSPTELTILPLHWSTDRGGAPRPDKAILVPGESNLYSAELWLMRKGAYGVEVTASGPGGGSVMIPVNSVAFERKAMPVSLSIIASALGLLLGAGILGIARAALRESTLPVGAPADAHQRLRGWLGLGLGSTIVAIAIFGGNLWWQVEEEAHRTRVLFRPLQHTLSVENEETPTPLHLKLTDSRMSQKNYALVPDHGKLMHLFLIDAQSPAQFVHLHPQRIDSRSFASELPNLAAGDYRVFADITHELGFSQTLTNRLTLPQPRTRRRPLSDGDDSIWQGQLEKGTKAQLPGGRTVQLQTGSLQAGSPVLLEASLSEPNGSPCALQPYLRMLGHAIVMRLDGAVFSHVHPSGTLSMAAAKRFANKVGGSLAEQEAEAICGDLSNMPAAELLALGSVGKVSFPFVFPSKGDYAIWIQARVSGTVLTGAFQVSIP